MTSQFRSSLTASPQINAKQTYSFKEFSKDYMEPSASTHYKTTGVYRKLLNDGEVADTTKNGLFKYVPNSTTFGNTWDARHMDKFLNSSPWGQSASTSMKNQISMEQSNSFLPVNGEGTNRSNSQNAMMGMMSLKSNANSNSNTSGAYGKESHYFRNGDRFSNEKSVIHDFTYKVAENNLNQFVTNEPVKESTLGNHYNQYLTRSMPAKDPRSLEFSLKSDTSALPHARREQMEQTKKEQKEFQEWKESNKIITKRNRVYHSGFKSGILGLDNPLYDSTKIYRDEYDQHQQLKQEKRRIEARHLEDITTHSRTNAQIEFMNKRSALIDSSPEYKQHFLERPIASKNAKTKVEAPYTQVLHNSQDRLFGAEVDKYSIRRADYLRSHEIRGKQYNILSNAVNDLELKHDKGERSGSRYDHPLGQSSLVQT